MCNSLVEAASGHASGAPELMCVHEVIARLERELVLARDQAGLYRQVGKVGDVEVHLQR